jgi:hypothetical protein
MKVAVVSKSCSSNYNIILFVQIIRSRSWVYLNNFRYVFVELTKLVNEWYIDNDYILCSDGEMKEVESIWNVMAHGDAWEGKWRGNWRMDWVARTLHTTSEHGVPSITIADAHTSAASSWLNWLPRWFKWTRPFRRKMKYGFCACTITFQMQSITCHIV